MAEFKSEVLQKIADNDARMEAFGDPSFLKALTNTQEAYSQTDDPVVKESLVDLIARRSNEETRSRLSLTLEQCVEIAGRLTKEEFATLALTFIFRYTVRNNLTTLASFHQFLNESINPFINDIPTEHSAFNYLEAQRCATINVTEAAWPAIFTGSYTAFFLKGFDRTEDQGGLNRLPPNFLIPCLHGNGRFQLSAVNENVFRELGGAVGLDEELITSAWATNVSTLMSPEEMLTSLRAHVPNFAIFTERWTETPLKNLTLTSAGLAIGYSSAARSANFDGDLAIWVR
jgi:hypothetical protein